MYNSITRKTLTGETFEAFDFGGGADTFMVKNFSGGDIYVSFDSNATTDHAAKIVKDYYQTFTYPSTGYASTIYVKGTGEVEVSQIL